MVCSAGVPHHCCRDQLVHSVRGVLTAQHTITPAPLPVDSGLAPIHPKKGALVNVYNTQNTKSNQHKQKRGTQQ